MPRYAATSPRQSSSAKSKSPALPVPSSVVVSSVVVSVFSSIVVVSEADESSSPPPQPAATSASARTRIESQRTKRDPNRVLRQVLGEESDDGVVAPHAVRELQDVVAFVLEHEVVDVATELAQLLDDVTRFPLDHTRVVLALDDEERARDVADVGPR